MNIKTNVKEHTPPQMKSNSKETETLNGGCRVSPCSFSSSSDWWRIWGKSYLISKLIGAGIGVIIGIPIALILSKMLR